MGQFREEEGLVMHLWVFSDAGVTIWWRFCPWCFGWSRLFWMFWLFLMFRISKCGNELSPVVIIIDVSTHATTYLRILAATTSYSVDDETNATKYFACLICM